MPQLTRPLWACRASLQSIQRQEKLEAEPELARGWNALDSADTPCENSTLLRTLSAAADALILEVSGQGDPQPFRRSSQRRSGGGRKDPSRREC